MTKRTREVKASSAFAASLLALSMSVTASTLDAVNATNHLEVRANAAARSCSAEVEAVRQKIRDAIKASAEMCVKLEKVQLRIVKRPDGITLDMLQNNPFPNMATTLRALEAQLRETSIPDELQSDAKDLARAIASVRSRASTVSNLLRQLHHAPVSLESDIDREGLKALTAMATDRIISLAS